MCILPLIRQFEAKSVLIVGEIAENCYQNELNSQIQSLHAPFQFEQLSQLRVYAILSVNSTILNFPYPKL